MEMILLSPVSERECIKNPFALETWSVAILDDTRLRVKAKPRSLSDLV